MTPGVLYRKYFVVPEGATVAQVTYKANNFENRMLVLAAQTFKGVHASSKFTLFDEYIRLEANNKAVRINHKCLRNIN